MGDFKAPDRPRHLGSPTPVTGTHTSLGSESPDGPVTAKDRLWRLVQRKVQEALETVSMAPNPDYVEKLSLRRPFGTATRERAWRGVPDMLAGSPGFLGTRQEGPGLAGES